MPRNQGIRLVAMMIFASWIRDKLKGYSRHIEYAMESAEKTGLFQKYVLRKKDGDKWCIGVFDENGRLMELGTSDSLREPLSKRRWATAYRKKRKRRGKGGESPQAQDLQARADSPDPSPIAVFPAVRQAKGLGRGGEMWYIFSRRCFG